MSETREREFDIAIVGYGPVGALLANLLGKLGLMVAVFERESDVNPLPRAVHFDGEVMRIFQSVGLAGRVATVARASSKGMHFVSADGKTLLIRRGIEGAGPHGWASNWYVHQPLLEVALRAGVERFPAVEVMLRHDVFAIDACERGAVIRAEDMSSGAIKHCRTKYVVGCDGARSLVRRLIGSIMEDLGLHQPWLVVDLLVDPKSKRMRCLPDHTVQLCDPKRPMTLVHVGGNRRRWEIMLMPGDDPRRLAEPAQFWPLLSRWVGPEDAIVERSAVYTFHSVIAKGWRRGRLLLAGDSCHQTPPFLGQGMCAGLRDAMNLAWKLAMIIKCSADDSLLDTYETERRPHVETFIQLAVELGSIIQTTDPRVAEERDRRFSEGEPRTFEFPQAQLGLGIRDASSPPTGVIFPQPRLADGRLLDEAVGGRFAILGQKAVIDTVDDLARSRWREVEATVIFEPGPELSAVLSGHGVGAIILRPDAYVFGLARNANELSMLSRGLPRCMATPASIVQAEGHLHRSHSPLPSGVADIPANAREQQT